MEIAKFPVRDEIVENLLSTSGLLPNAERYKEGTGRNCEVFTQQLNGLDHVGSVIAVAKELPEVIPLR